MIRPLFASFMVAVASPAVAVDIQEVTSPLGIEAWLVEDHSIPFTALSMAFEGGTSLDPEGQRGVISLMTATLEEGAGPLNATDFAQAVEALGASASFTADDDALTVQAKALSENRDEAAALLRDALVVPRFDELAVERVKGQVLSSIRARENNPQALAGIALAHNIWGDHPYGSPNDGTEESILPLKPDDLRAAKDRVLARDRVYIGAAGDITPTELGALIDSILADLPATASAPLPANAQWQGTGATTTIPWTSPQSVISFAQPGIDIADPDYFAAHIADYILGGGGFSSRLTEEIREKRGLTYGVSTGLSEGAFGDSWIGGMSVANPNVGQAVELLREGWAHMSEGVTEDEVSAARTYITGEYALRWDGNSRIASILAGMQLVGLDIDYPDRRNDLINAVTVEDVNRVARARLDPNALEVVIVGQPEGL